LINRFKTAPVYQLPSALTCQPNATVAALLLLIPLIIFQRGRSEKALRKP
jgi:hypothetical protein